MTDRPGRWQKGQSGNPNGRPRVGVTLAEVVRHKVKPEWLVNELYIRGKEGSIQALEILLERGWGKAPLQLLLTPTTQRYDFDALTSEELDLFEQLVEKMDAKRLTESAIDTLSAG